MFGSLFEDEDDTNTVRGPSSRSSGNSSVVDCTFPRGQTGLCGLKNQGATCYLNSLLQTLFFTPEFRDDLLGLNTAELEDSSENGSSKARVIPLQLQSLFAQLLLLDQDSISTSSLTESFGWTGNESFQQHDVQELNRILFGAIESSLIGTSAENLIRNLYHGTSVTQVICQECGRVSEREEDFLDLPATVAGCGGLEQSLMMCYVAMETLDGPNQYKCGSCNKLVDAVKGAKLRSLPSILSFSLLRFSYDLQRGERFKETKKYSFPLLLDMTVFCESPHDSQEYELYSVVIHSGSCHGGHYHAYIRDIQGLGMWTSPEEEMVHVTHENDDGQLDVMSCHSPVELVGVLLSTLGGSASLDQLCQRMVKETGTSWNKRYKAQYGTFNKFLKKHSDVFQFSDSGRVMMKNEVRDLSVAHTVKTESPVDEVDTPTQEKVEELDKASATVDCKGKKKSEEVPCRGEALLEGRWFDVNDSRITCIHENALQNQFAGKESAYMLFYRKKNLSVSTTTSPGSHGVNVPDRLVSKVGVMNAQLVKERYEHDLARNRISLFVHVARNFTVRDGTLVPKEGVWIGPANVAIDRRKRVNELVELIKALELQNNDKEETLHIARKLPAGLHLYEKLTGQQNERSTLVDLGVRDSTELFLWSGYEVDSKSVYTGADREPILINTTFSLQTKNSLPEIQRAFHKDTTVGEIKFMLGDFVGINADELNLSVIKTRGKVIKLSSLQDGNTLGELDIQDYEGILADEAVHNKSATFASSPSVASQESEKQKIKLTFTIENRCEPHSRTIDGSTDYFAWPSVSVGINKDQIVSSLKTLALSMFNSSPGPDECCLRVDHDLEGLGPPLYDNDTTTDAGLTQGMKLVLEPSPPPQQGQIALQFYVCSPGQPRTTHELIFSKASSIRECLHVMLKDVGLEGLDWHLRKTNWCAEPADMMEDENATLEDERLSNGDLVIIEEGRLPPKGFVRLSIWRSSCDPSVNSASDGGVLSWVTSGIQGLLGFPPNVDHEEPKPKDHVFFVGEVEISQDATLSDLKQQICTLPKLSVDVVPTPSFVRLQEMINGHPRRVLKNSKETIRRLKLNSSTQLFMQVLEQEEDLRPSAILLNTRRRRPASRDYDSVHQVVFDPRDGATPSSLYQCVSEAENVSRGQLVIAKYFNDKYEWRIILDTDFKKSSGKGKGKNKKINLRHAPIHLQDGDIIGIKDSLFDPDGLDDFSTIEDDEGKAKLRQIEEDKKQRRNKKGQMANRPEIPLKIHVDDFT